jgi:hypothetical protein
MNICYLDFWPGFDSNCNWFNLLFREALDNIKINFNSAPEEADIIMFSSFGSQNLNYKNSRAVKLFYTGENERANLSVADYSLSFDYDSHDGRNFRLPHWYMYVNWWDEPNFPHARISKERLFKKYDPEEVFSRKEFCSIIIGNPVRNRIEVAQKLDTFKPVHGYGRVFTRPYSGCKVDLMEKYRYNICFENSIYPGYVTEKLFHALYMNTIPIYWGSPTVEMDFNSKAFISRHNYETDVDMLEHIISLDTNDDNYNEMLSQPILNPNNKVLDLNRFNTWFDNNVYRGVINK